MKILVFLWSIAYLLNDVECQDIAFPVNNEATTKENFSERTIGNSTTESWQRETTSRLTPVRDPHKCPGNQFFYPGDPWFCDCGPNHVYYRPKDECYPIFMKGPCQQGQHLILERRVVVCVHNPCQDGFVRYSGGCYQLEKSDGPCEKINGTTAILRINPNSLSVECSRTTAETLTLLNFPNRCPPGSKRDSNNKCRENWNV